MESVPCTELIGVRVRATKPSGKTSELWAFRVPIVGDSQTDFRPTDEEMLKPLCLEEVEETTP